MSCFDGLLTPNQTAVSDGLKRALRLFGNYMGNSLGDINHVNTLLTEKGLPPNGKYYSPRTVY